MSAAIDERDDDLLDVAMNAAWKAGRLTLAHFQTGVRPDRKYDGSPVTIADRQAEECLRALIGSRYPDHAIVGEEFGESGRPSRFRWWLDPIDGTHSFVHGVPLYGVLVGLEVDDHPRIGVAHFPALDETYAASPSTGCLWNGRRVRVSEVRTLDAALLAYTPPRPECDDATVASWLRLRRATRLQRGWSDCYGHCLVASGRADIMLDPRMNPWDCAALVPVLREAGGTFTDWRGSSTIHGGNAVSTNGHLHDAVVAQLAARAATTGSSR